MSNSIENYRNLVNQPWGKMFYDIIYHQLVVPNDKKSKIIDFGAGFCLTADHYAEFHDVIALEPNTEMSDLRVRNNDYTLVTQGIEYLETKVKSSVDVIICHNVLEYVDDMNAVLKQFVRVLKPGGLLSIVKHNDLGRVMFYAVLQDNPRAALDLLSKDEKESSIFGKRNVYDNESLVSFLGDEMKLKETYGIRTFYGLSSNNDIKFNGEWYQPMLELEIKAGKMDEYKKIAFFNHLVFEKK